MKNFNILVVREKIQVLGRSQKPIYRGIAWKGGLGQFADWRQELGKKEGGVYTPIHTMIHIYYQRKQYKVT